MSLVFSDGWVFVSAPRVLGVGIVYCGVVVFLFAFLGFPAIRLVPVGMLLFQGGKSGQVFFTTFFYDAP